ncbi:hypothetical protein ES703_112935 [subsurface metagenome]
MNEIAPKKRIRLRQFLINHAGATPDLDFEGIMSDILPDEPWELVAVMCTVNTKVGSGVVTYVALGKNVHAAEGTVVVDGLAKKPGIILHYEPAVDQAAATAQMRTMFFPFPEPIHFDESDKLNIYSRNSGAQITTFVVTIHYRVL